VSVKIFFKLFCSDESTFTKLYHEHRGDKDLTVKKWSNSPQFGLIRDVLFMSPVKVPLGPSHTRIHETQRYHLTKNRLLIDTISMMLDIPYGDSFRVEGKWDVTSATPESCKLVVNIGVHFMKKTWFKGKIETQTIKETRESFQQWAALAPSEIAKYKAHSSPALSALPTASALTTKSHSAAPSSVPRQEGSAHAPAHAATPPHPAPSLASDATVSVDGALPDPFAWRKSGADEEGRFAMVTKALASLYSSFSSLLGGQSVVSVLLFLVLGFIFINMYLRIVYLEGKVATLENILHPLLAKSL